MKNKKIVINIDVENKRVRKGFVDSNVNKKKDKEDKVNNKADIKKQNQKEKRKKEKNVIKKKEHNFSEQIPVQDYDNEYLENSDNETVEKLQQPKIEYIRKSELDKISKGINIVNKHKKKEKKERQKRIGKTLKEVEKEREEMLNENDTINFKPVVISFVIVVITIALYSFFKYGPILGISLNIDRAASETKIDIVSTEGDFYATYNDELLVYSNQVLTTYNKNGKKTWNYTLDQMFTPNIYIEDKYMVVSNNTSGNIYLFENKKEILNKKVDGKISNIYIDKSGYLAIEYASNGYRKIIGIYNKNGANVYNTFFENDTIADIKILDNSKKILVTKINSTSFKAGVEVVLVDSTKQEDNIKQIAKLDNNFVYDLTIQGPNIIMLLDNELININIDTYEKRVIKSFETSQILYFTLSDNYFTCVEKELNSTSNEYVINNLRFDGTVVSSFKINNSPKLVVTSGLLSYFVYQDSYSAVNKWGVEVADKKLSSIPKDIVVFNNEKSVALVYTNIIYIENL